MLNKLLSIIGLMTIARARKINEEICATNQRYIAEQARLDFGVPSKSGFEEEARRNANVAFDALLHADISKGVASEDEIQQGYWNGYNRI